MSVEMKVALSSFGGNHVDIKGLTEDEAEKVEGMVRAGTCWMKVVDGRIEFHPTMSPLPGPADDEAMLPFWRRAYAEEMVIQEEIFDPKEVSRYEHSSPSFKIQSLCGYNYTPENYKREAEKLESWGFECLRSRRQPNGQFWEIWYLPGLWASKGELREHVGKGFKSSKKLVEKAIAFLCRKASFGTLDVAVQMAAMPVPD